MENLIKNPIFTGVSIDEIEKMVVCFEAEKKFFREKETVSVYDVGCQKVGLLYHGCVSINRINADGSLDMLEYIENSGIFGAAFSFYQHEDEFIVICEKNCTILFVDKTHITKRCSNACAHHSIVIENLLSFMSEKISSLTEKVDILSHRTIREKLLCYFRVQLAKKSTNYFHLPFSYLALANYLCIDRSAMMRELKKMKEDDVVQVSGKRIFLNYTPKS
ncbi:Crp/Fnr family transcriptional regulator [Anaerotignum sp. MB30-C6]|uniref:Crp/Fnr family transcriptional regulator n=1 Tax=Anaerotignum sp. MB30-C6 TaxID=3070814 RepID=UPI0027DDE048|nr:Crp/Fnr family transcriptional regulator [Anaerotignum sp. MB30-C6]WMI81176.1 Crp/Fnr family transcriptional regulator [Anaerotignum sp. MB30-C6]